MKQKDRKKLNILILFVNLIAFFFIYNLVSISQSNLLVGEVATQNVISKVTFENEAATKLQIEQSRNSIGNIYKVLPNIAIEKKDLITGFGASLGDVRNRTDLAPASKLQYIKSSSKIPLTDEDYRYLLNAKDEDLNKIISVSNDLLSSAYSRGIRELNLENEKINLINSVDEISEDGNMGGIIKKIISYSMVPNEIVDEELTENARNNAAERVEPVMVNEGDTVALAGELITADKVELISKSGNKLDTNESIGIKFIRAALLILLPMVIWLAYIYNLQSSVYLSNKFIVLIIANLILLMISALSVRLSPIFIPIIALALITGIYVHEKMTIPNAIYMILVASIFYGLMGEEIVFLLLAIFPVGIFINKNSSNSEIFRVSLISSLLAATVYIFMKLDSFNSLDILLNYIYAGMMGILSAIVAIGSGIMWENGFKLLTTNKLNELLDTNKPLLKELLEKAPGTYQHSFMVANLAENAAKKTSADYNLAKVGSFYHDIGKIMNPKYFKENQFGIDNPHDLLEPAESAEIIINHVRDGVLLAKKYNLPKEVIAFIEEHHGTTLVSYFYYMAKEANPEVDENSFKYTIRKPQSIETAIVMIADSCEAATRSMATKTPEAIEIMVNNIVDGKIKEKQFSECSITFLEIEKIKEEIIRNIKSIYHERIEYPKESADA